MSRVSAHRARGWSSLTKNKMSPPPLEILLRDLLSRARHRRQRGDERPVREIGKEDAAAVLRGEAGELGRRVVEADAPRGEARRHRREVLLAHAAVVARIGELPSSCRAGPAR